MKKEKPEKLVMLAEKLRSEWVDDNVTSEN